ncbi:hypothetical protein [Micromonospora sp. WMMD1274]|uniref:hypothetical protein n=1 Tax=Micromonospora sp. WMMD1274 TaxID=3404116 RepID=UPI003B92303B
MTCRACRGTGRCPLCKGQSAGILFVCGACAGTNRCYMECRDEQLPLFEVPVELPRRISR